MKYKAQINNHFDVEINPEHLANLDVVLSDDGTFHILQDNQAYAAQVVEVNYEKKQFHIKVNGRDYQVNLEDQFDQLVSALGLEVVSGMKLKDVKAPMPGLVLDVAVSPGQEIKKGDKLLILEAMKMENVIKSDGEGIIKAIHINEGIAVDKGQLLIEME